MTGKFIGTVAKEFGVNPRTLRFYEAVRLLRHPARTESGYRVYDDEAVRRLAFIAKAKGLGLSLEEIRQVLVMRDNGRMPCDSVQRILTDRIRRITAQVAQLRAFKSDLQAMLARCRRRRKASTRAAASKAICPVIEAPGNGANGRIKHGGEWR